jgi:hypothetical protein
VDVALSEGLTTKLEEARQAVRHLAPTSVLLPLQSEGYEIQNPFPGISSSWKGMLLAYEKLKKEGIAGEVGFMASKRLKTASGQYITLPPSSSGNFLIAVNILWVRSTKM